MTNNRQFRTIVLLISGGIIGLFLAIGLKGSPTQRSLINEPILLKSEYMWDPESIRIKDWQILRSPRQIINGPPGELLVSDRSRSLIFQISTSGKTGFAIGHPGNGPGEFQQPTDLNYQTENNLLWIGDRYLSRVTLMRLMGDEGSYVDSVNHPSMAGGSFAHGIAIASDTSFWISPRRLDNRLQHLSIDGEVITQVGEQWVPPEVSRGSLWIYNQNSIIDTPYDYFFVLWHTKPIVEKWSNNGDMLGSYDISCNEIDVLKDQFLAPAEAPHFIRCGCIDLSDNTLCLALYSLGNETPILKLDLSTFKIIKRYVALTTEDNNIVSIAADDNKEDVFYTIDRSNQILLVLKP